MVWQQFLKSNTDDSHKLKSNDERITGKIGSCNIENNVGENLICVKVLQNPFKQNEKKLIYIKCCYIHIAVIIP